MVGHTELQKDLKKLADKGELAHGYIFFGPPRVGKATFARSLANYLETKEFDWDAEKPPVLGDMTVVAPTREKRTLGIDAVREIRHFLSQTPNRSSRRTVILDGGEFLTAEAENALLKITEEPHLRALIMLIIDDPERLLPTLRSRLQKIFFAPVASADIAKWLAATQRMAPTRAAELAKESGGLPGLAFKTAGDKAFEELKHQAKEFVRATGYARKTFIKELADSDTFNFNEFLEALTLVLFSDRESVRQKTALWHRLLELRRNENSYNLNPRLQLTALAEHLK